MSVVFFVSLTYYNQCNFTFHNEKLENVSILRNLETMLNKDRKIVQC